mmetsp:Transcript_9600/g.30536  ORF Transcript_9600/g.30536 Transcript_9600/m.30536 type:complete len:283 (+) Transcript_9600:96-944(+)
MAAAWWVIAAGLLRPAAAVHGFRDSRLVRERGSQAHGHAWRLVGQTARGALGAAIGSDPATAGARASEVFDRYDLQEPTDQLSDVESAALLKDLGFADSETRQVVAEMDADSNRFVDRREFIEYLQPSEQTKASLPEAAPQPKAHPAGTPSVAGVPPLGSDEAAKRLQNTAGRTQDTLVDAVENAQIAEIKRSVFRGLSRLRSASVREYDAIATGITEHYNNYTEYYHYRMLHNPMAGVWHHGAMNWQEPDLIESKVNQIHHLSDSEEPVSEDKKASFHYNA